MFVLNGNRRPSPSFVVKLTAKKGAHATFGAFNQTIRNGVNALSYNVTKVGDIQKAFSDRSFDTAIHYNVPIESINPKESHVLFNVVSNKNKKHKDYGTIAYLYVLPKTLLVENPTQYKSQFRAILKADTLIPTVTVNKDPIIKLFKFNEARNKVIYVRSVTEANFHADVTGLTYKVVEGLHVNGDIYVDTKKINITPIDTSIYSINLVKNEGNGKRISKLFSIVTANTGFKAYVDKDTTALPAGIYKTKGDKSGFLFIEELTSQVTGVVKLVHFFESDDNKVKPFIEHFGISKVNVPD